MLTGATLVLLPLDGPDDPGYATPNNGQAPAVTNVPHVCGVVPIACGWHWDPGTGTWKGSG
jgi:hypothetical protein